MSAPATTTAANQNAGGPSSTIEPSRTHVASAAVVASHHDHGVTRVITIQPTRAATAKLHIGAPANASVDIDAAVAASGAIDDQLPPMRRALPHAAAISATLQLASGTYHRSPATSAAGASQRAINATNGDASAVAASPAPTGTVIVRASRRQTESARMAAMVSAPSRTIAGRQNQTMPSTSPLISEVTTPEPKTATLTTASGPFRNRWASAAITPAAIVHDSGADHTRTSPVAPMRARVPVPMPASARATSSGATPTATASVSARRVEPSSSRAAAPAATITGAGTAVSAESPTAARPNAPTVAALNRATLQRRDCTSVAASAARPPTNVHIDQGWPSVAAAATPTGAVRHAASVASAVEVAGYRRRPASAAKYTPSNDATRPENRTIGSIDSQLPATTMIDATSSRNAPVAASHPAADSRGRRWSGPAGIGVVGAGHGEFGGGRWVLSMPPIVNVGGRWRHRVNPPVRPGAPCLTPHRRGGFSSSTLTWQSATIDGMTERNDPGRTEQASTAANRTGRRHVH